MIGNRYLYESIRKLLSSQHGFGLSKAGILIVKINMSFSVLPLSPYYYAGDTDEQSKVNQTKEGDAMKLPKQGEWSLELDVCQSLIFQLCCTPCAP